MITGNHFSYRRSRDVADAIAALAAKHKFIKPHWALAERQGGEVQTAPLQVEWAFRALFLTNAERAGRSTGDPVRDRHASSSEAPKTSVPLPCRGSEWYTRNGLRTQT